jgi:hypothetical protein
MDTARHSRTTMGRSSPPQSLLVLLLVLLPVLLPVLLLQLLGLLALPLGETLADAWQRSCCRRAWHSMAICPTACRRAADAALEQSSAARRVAGPRCPGAAMDSAHAPGVDARRKAGQTHGRCRRITAFLPSAPSARCCILAHALAP